MSLNLLTVPNDYHLYAGSITQSNPDTGNTPTMRTIVLPAQNLVAAPPITIVSMTIRGTGSPPPLGGAISLTIVEDESNTLVSMTIPSFQITAATGSTIVGSIGLLPAGIIPALYLPQFVTQWAISIFLNNPAPGGGQVISTQFGYGTLTMLTNGQLTIQPPITNPGTSFSVGNPLAFGISGDITVTYSPTATA